MDRINKYKAIIYKLLEKEANQAFDPELSVPRILVVDTSENRYILLAKGWQKKKYIHYFIYHIEIIDNKIWIHEDRTDTGFANVLVEEGIDKNDIVLGFLPEYTRSSSDFAVV